MIFLQKKKNKITGLLLINIYFYIQLFQQKENKNNLNYLNLNVNKIYSFNILN